MPFTLYKHHSRLPCNFFMIKKKYSAAAAVCNYAVRTHCVYLFFFFWHSATQKTALMLLDFLKYCTDSKSRNLICVCITSINAPELLCDLHFTTAGKKKTVFSSSFEDMFLNKNKDWEYKDSTRTSWPFNVFISNVLNRNHSFFSRFVQGKLQIKCNTPKRCF